MEPYKEMYLKLFNSVTDSIEQIRSQNFGMAMEILIKAQQDSEELYISSGQ